MNTKITIRRARPDLVDATLLRETEQHTLGDSDYTAQEMLDVLSRPEHVAYFACASGTRHEPPIIVGFLSCFFTGFVKGQICMEADMLGVRIDHRRQGIATALIRAAATDAKQRGVRRMRAVIAEDNVASQGAFGRAGFQRTEPLRAMLVHELEGLEAPLASAAAMHHVVGGGLARQDDLVAVRGERHELSISGGGTVSATCLPVRTLAYRGLWLEELAATAQSEIAAMGAELACQALARQLDEVGYLAPLTTPGQTQALLDVGYQEVGRYWVYRRDVTPS